MASYVLSRVTVNGEEAEAPVFTVTMDADKAVTAVYMEAQHVNIEIENAGTEDAVLVKTSSETITIPAGQTITLPFDPAKDKLVLK